MVRLKFEPQLTTRISGKNIRHGTMGPKVPTRYKRAQRNRPIQKSKLKTFTVQKRRNMVQFPFAGVHSSTFPSV